MQTTTPVMPLPDVTRVLRFSGPTALTVCGYSYPLPVPAFSADAEEDPAFREQVHNL